MDQEVETVIPCVRHLVYAERHIPYYAVEKTIRILCMLKSLYGDMVFLVKLPRDPAGNTVDLHTVHLKPAHLFRHKPHKIPCATGRLQYISLPQSHISKGFIHCLYDHRRRIKRI